MQREIFLFVYDKNPYYRNYFVVDEGNLVQLRSRKNSRLGTGIKPWKAKYLNQEYQVNIVRPFPTITDYCKHGRYSKLLTLLLSHINLYIIPVDLFLLWAEDEGKMMQQLKDWESVRNKMPNYDSYDEEMMYREYQLQLNKYIEEKDAYERKYWLKCLAPLQTINGE